MTAQQELERLERKQRRLLNRLHRLMDLQRTQGSTAERSAEGDRLAAEYQRLNPQLAAAKQAAYDEQRQAAGVWYVRREGSAITWHIAVTALADARCGESRPRRGWYDAVHERPSAWVLCIDCDDAPTRGDAAPELATRGLPPMGGGAGPAEWPHDYPAQCCEAWQGDGDCPCYCHQPTNAPYWNELEDAASEALTQQYLDTLPDDLSEWQVLDDVPF